MQGSRLWVEMASDGGLIRVISGLRCVAVTYFNSQHLEGVGVFWSR